MHPMQLNGIGNGGLLSSLAMRRLMDGSTGTGRLTGLVDEMTGGGDISRQWQQELSRQTRWMLIIGASVMVLVSGMSRVERS